MEKYNIIQRVLERNSYGNTTVLLNKTPFDYVRAKMQYDTHPRDNYKINIEVKTVEFIDETVWMKFAHVIDHDDEVDFIMDVYIALTYHDSFIRKGDKIIPAVYNEKHEKYLCREDYFVYDNKLIAILGDGETEICCKLCDISEFMKQNIILIYDNPSKLSRADAKNIIRLSKQC